MVGPGTFQIPTNTGANDMDFLPAGIDLVDDANQLLLVQA